MEILDEITVFVDRNLPDKSVQIQLIRLIRTDPAVRKEYLIQKTVKELLNRRFQSRGIKPYSGNLPIQS